MRADPAALPHAPRTRRARRSTADRLRDALLKLAGGHGRIASHTETAWASITFAGTRHRLELLFEDADGVAAGERLIEALPDHEFGIAGQLVADASVRAVDHSLLPEARLAVSVELLLLEEG